MSSPLPCIAVSMGDPAGIGPELVLHALASDALSNSVQLIVYGSRAVLTKVAESSGIAFKAPLTLNSTAQIPVEHYGHLLIDDSTIHEQQAIKPGTVSAICGKAAEHWIRQAAADVLCGKAQALVTAPINKEALNLAGSKFTGHTEMLAEIANASEPCMVFFSSKLIIALATIHTALANVPGLLTTRKLIDIAVLLNTAVKRLGIKSPRIGMLALNPHGGENGLFGSEEQRIIMPAIKEAQTLGVDIQGPLVPDTAFTWLGRDDQSAPFDAWIAMYHDQALIPFKMAAFDEGVNVTLGLSFLRTSPDHGTAFDLAWQGKASPASFFSAIMLALRMGNCHNSV